MIKFTQFLKACLKSMCLRRNVVIFALCLVSLCSIAADGVSIVGKWQTWDDQTNSPGSVIQISGQDGKYIGTIVQTVKEGVICTACQGDRHDQPMQGLELIRDGKILNPRNGKEYRCKLQLSDDGQKLYVKVYKGIFSKTKVWSRVD